MDVLGELGIAGEGAFEAGEGEEPPPIIEAWNKLDLLDEDAATLARETAARRSDVVVLSALTGAGVDDLQRAVRARLTAGAQVHRPHDRKSVVYGKRGSVRVACGGGRKNKKNT